MTLAASRSLRSAIIQIGLRRTNRSEVQITIPCEEADRLLIATPACPRR
jgi:hypothetical protein